MAGLLAIPIGLTISFQRDAMVMDHALRHVYAPAPGPVEDLPSKSAVERVTEAARRHKVRNRNEFFVNGIPLISPLYDKIVFKGLSVSDSKLDLLEEVFLGDTSPKNENGVRGWTSTFRPPLGTVTLDQISTRTTWDPAAEMWSTWVDLSMTNNETFQAEYATTFELPPGAFIRDHYLMIGERLAQEILAERKAASWIYRQITTITRQDPSLIRYIGPERLELRVFPFDRHETRTTGFEVISRKPFELTLDDKHAQIGRTDEHARVGVTYSTDGTGVFIPAAEKENLSTTIPKRTVWFILDRSARSSVYTDQLIQLVEQKLALPELASADVRFLVSNASTTVVGNKDWQQVFREMDTQGGLLLDHAMDAVLQHYRDQRDSYPLVIVASAHADKLVKTERLQYAMAALGLPPEWLVLQMDGSLHLHALDGVDEGPRDLESLMNEPLKTWIHDQDVVLLPDDGTDDFIIIDGPRPERDPRSDHWRKGLDLRTLHAWNVLEPARTLLDEHADAKASLAAGILGPATAYICLENTAQEIALRRKQDEILNGSSLMDAGEELRSMSEPSDLYLLPALLVFAIWRIRISMRS